LVFIGIFSAEMVLYWGRRTRPKMKIDVNLKEDLFRVKKNDNHFQN